MHALVHRHMCSAYWKPKNSLDSRSLNFTPLCDSFVTGKKFATTSGSPQRPSSPAFLLPLPCLQHSSSSSNQCLPYENLNIKQCTMLLYFFFIFPLPDSSPEFFVLPVQLQLWRGWQQAGKTKSTPPPSLSITPLCQRSCLHYTGLVHLVFAVAER